MLRAHRILALCLMTAPLLVRAEQSAFEPVTERTHTQVVRSNAASYELAPGALR